ncbi:MAG: hypothetical protein E5Y58_13565 [Mesorhizobium sp.]|nr:MAG: hypothetical protein E5Y58_13565 [Mesorhizobium sp.]
MRMHLSTAAAGFLLLAGIGAAAAQDVVFYFWNKAAMRACRNNQFAEACHVIMSRTGSYALETSGGDHLLSTAVNRRHGQAR